MKQEKRVEPIKLEAMGCCWRTDRTFDIEHQSELSDKETPTKSQSGIHSWQLQML